MKRLTEIPINVISTESKSAASGNLLPLLHELSAMLERLLNTGVTDGIDLRHAPLSQDDIVVLKELLGQGEVKVTVETLGPTCIYETAFPGVWWVSHYDQGQQLLAEFIEVADTPELLRVHPHEILTGLNQLRRKLVSPFAK